MNNKLVVEERTPDDATAMSVSKNTWASFIVDFDQVDLTRDSHFSKIRLMSPSIYTRFYIMSPEVAIFFNLYSSRELFLVFLCCSIKQKILLCLFPIHVSFPNETQSNF